MLSAEFDLTIGPVTVTDLAAQEPAQALDVSAYSSIACLVHLVSAPDLTADLIIDIETSMSRDEESNWVTLSSTGFDADEYAARYLVVSSGVLKYIRWRVSSIGDAREAIFHIHGMLRAP